MSSVLKMLNNLDARVWQALTFLIVSFLLLYPIGLPLTVSSETRNSYQIVQSLQPGDIVLVNYDIAAYGWDELSGQCLSVIPHLMTRPGVKVIFMTDMDQGTLFIQNTIKAIGTLESGKTDIPWYQISDKHYLKDYIIMGYYPGNENAFAALANDYLKNAGTKDWYGNDATAFFSSIGLKTAADFKLAISFDCFSGMTFLTKQFYLAFHTPIIAGEIGVNVPPAINDLNAGLIKGLIKSTAGAAEYQFLSGFKGAALISMDAYSAVHILLIIAIIVGNIAWFGYGRKLKGVK
jgi:hypothetical protein